jgi:MGT family glycosyltransferase
MFAAAAVLTGIPRAERPLVVNLGIVPLSLKHHDVAPFGLGVKPMPGALGRLRNAVLTTVAEKAIFAPVQHFADEIARVETGRPLRGFFLDWPSRADLLLQFTVPEFEYERPGLPGHVRFVGPVSRARPSTVEVPDWWTELERGDRRVVHVTQGTVANSDWSLIEPTVRALAGEDLLVVVSTGGRPVDSLPGDLPGNVRAASYLPYDRLLPLTDVLVTNGGYGGVHYALEHGVPLVVAGRTEDKVEVNARVAWSGAGIDLRTDAPTSKAMAAAVRTVLADGRYREAADRIGTAIRRSPGPAAVHDLLAEALATTPSVVE